MTVWVDERAMKAFRNGGAHLRAMPRLTRWCDEASYVHWEQDDAAVPTAAAAFARLGESGRLSKVRHPANPPPADWRVGRLTYTRATSSTTATRVFRRPVGALYRSVPP